MQSGQKTKKTYANELQGFEILQYELHEFFKNYRILQKSSISFCL